MPVVRAKLEPEAERLPAISGENSPMPVVRAKLEPEAGILPAISAENSPMPVVRATSEPAGARLPVGENSPMPVVRATSEPAGARLPVGENSPMPVVRANVGVPPELALQRDPLRSFRQLESLQPLNPTGSLAVTPERRTAKSQPVVAQQPAAGPTGAGTPLVLPVPPALAGQGREANSSQPLASAPHSPGTGNTAKTAASQQTPARLPPVSGAQAERNIGPETEKPAKIDTDELADKIERKLMRRIRIENERRGRGQWR